MRTHVSITLILGVAACGGRDDGPTTPDPTTATTATAIDEEAVDRDELVAELVAELEQPKDPLDEAQLHARLGNLLWQRSCPDAVDGLCVTTTAARESSADRKKKRGDAPTACGPNSTPKRVVQPRDADDAAEATRHFEAAMKLWNGGALVSDPPPADGESEVPLDFEKVTREARLVMEIGDLRLALADQELEALFSIRPPDYLDFDKDKVGSMKRFDGWFRTVGDQGREARAAYEAILADQKLAAWMPDVRIGAMFRIGQISGWWGDQLFAMPIPEDMRTGEFSDDMIDAFCDALSEKAEVLFESATEAWAACVAEANATVVTGRWPEQCRHEYNVIFPTRILP